METQDTIELKNQIQFLESMIALELIRKRQGIKNSNKLNKSWLDYLFKYSKK